MKNFKIVDKKTGKEYWMSRSTAVTCAVIAFKPGGDLYFLMEKRGQGCPDNRGKWVFPCGYVDYSETFKHAAVREVYEETGLEIDKKNLHFCGVDDGPSANHQNITFRFLTIEDFWSLSEKLKSGAINGDSINRGGEKNEVDALELKSYDWISKNPGECAFHHPELAKTIVENIDFIRTDHFYRDSNTGFLKGTDTDPDKKTWPEIKQS